METDSKIDRCSWQHLRSQFRYKCIRIKHKGREGGVCWSKSSHRDLAGGWAVLSVVLAPSLVGRAESTDNVQWVSVWIPLRQVLPWGYGGGGGRATKTGGHPRVSQCQALQGVRREARPGMFGQLY
ncbi:unnamed protein product, partial [Meganyctiphanes norvegica]